MGTNYIEQLNISGKQTMAQTCTALSLNFIIPGPEEGL
jgi:hypothetical protein